MLERNKRERGSHGAWRSGWNAGPHSFAGLFLLHDARACILKSAGRHRLDDLRDYSGQKRIGKGEP